MIPTVDTTTGAWRPDTPLQIPVWYFQGNILYSRHRVPSRLVGIVVIVVYPRRWLASLDVLIVIPTSVALAAVVRGRWRRWRAGLAMMRFTPMSSSRCLDVCVYRATSPIPIVDTNRMRRPRIHDGWKEIKEKMDLEVTINQTKGSALLRNDPDGDLSELCMHLVSGLGICETGICDVPLLCTRHQGLEKPELVGKEFATCSPVEAANCFSPRTCSSWYWTPDYPMVLEIGFTVRRAIHINLTLSPAFLCLRVTVNEHYF